MDRVLTAELAELFQLDLVGRLLLVLVRRIVLTLAIRTIQTDRDSHTAFSLVGGEPFKARPTQTITR